jgi:glutamate decarboxylase
MAERTRFDEEIEVAAPGAFLTKGAPETAIPETSMTPIAAMRLLQQELAVEGIPERNLATFVTTWMEPEARVVINENLLRNFIDHAEYPMTAEIEQRCIHMLAELFNAPGETTGARTQGSSEAIMLGALSLKWKWRKRREAEGKPTDKPNLVFGGDVHVVWEKFCRYFDVAPRIVPLQSGKFTIGPEDVEPHVDENTIGVAAVVGTPSRATRMTWSASTISSSGSATRRGSTCRFISTARAEPSSGRSSTRTRPGISGSRAFGRSTPLGTSSGSSTPGSAG